MSGELTLLYFDGCPHEAGVFRAATEAARRLGEGWSIIRIDLASLPTDDPRRGYGSPTILLNGSDLGGLPEPGSSSLGCRYYPDGPPTVEMIVRTARERSAGAP